MVYNILSCKGWEVATKIGLSFGDCMMAKLFVVILFFLLAIFRKWGAEMFGLQYSFIVSILAGIVGYLILVTLTGNPTLSFGIGIVAGLAGGFFGGTVWPDGGGE